MLAAGLLSLVTLLSMTRPMPRIDRVLQDSARAALASPPSQDIVMVAIDEESLAAIGHWPWRRSVHAELLRQIAVHLPRCVGLNLPLVERDLSHPEDDAALARAMSDSGCIVLPMRIRTLGARDVQELLPAPELADAADAIGHSRLAFDRDGIARSVYLHEGFAGSLRPHFALALRDAAEGRITLPTEPTPVGADAYPRSWLRTNPERIVFSRGADRFKTVSYIDVLNGNVPPDVFRDRYVLVGPTAPGLGDLHANVAPDVPGLMSGIEIYANVLQTLISGRHVTVAEPWQNLLFNLVPLAVALLGVLWLRPAGVIALVGAMLLFQLAIHLARPSVGVLFAPAAGVTGLLLLYPLWSLLRLSAAFSYLRKGTEELTRELGQRALEPARRPAGDFLDRQMVATQTAIDHMRDMHRFVRDGLDHLPDATMTLDTAGRVVLANGAALAHWQRSPAEMIGQDVHVLLAEIRRRTTGAPMMPPGALSRELHPIVGESVDPQGRALLLRCVPFFNAAGAHAGWMIALVDISEMRSAQSQRDEALRFISHDAREPSAAILTIVELARERPEAFTQASLLESIERHAQTGLELADGFVNLARAEAEPFHTEVLDLIDLLRQAIDNAWARAQRQQVDVLLVTRSEEALCIADRNLLNRAFANVLSNALKFSPQGAALECSIREDERHWRIAFQDEGPGIAVELQSQLFQPFHRLHHEGHPEVHGVGLGLLLVRTVVHRHGGTVEIDSAAGTGCTVTLVLPKPTMAEVEALAPAAAQEQ